MAQMIASYLGIYQESTYAEYGSAWRESLFYTVPETFAPALSLLPLPRRSSLVFCFCELLCRGLLMADC